MIGTVWLVTLTTALSDRPRHAAFTDGAEAAARRDAWRGVARFGDTVTVLRQDVVGDRVTVTDVTGTDVTVTDVTVTDVTVTDVTGTDVTGDPGRRPGVPGRPGPAGPGDAVLYVGPRRGSTYRVSVSAHADADQAGRAGLAELARIAARSPLTAFETVYSTDFPGSPSGLDPRCYGWPDNDPAAPPAGEARWTAIHDGTYPPRRLRPAGDGMFTTWTDPEPAGERV